MADNGSEALDVVEQAMREWEAVESGPEQVCETDVLLFSARDHQAGRNGTYSADQVRRAAEALMAAKPQSSHG